MQLSIMFENKKLKTEIKAPTTIKDLKVSIQESINDKDSELILLSDKFEILGDLRNIDPEKDGKEMKLYLLLHKKYPEEKNMVVSSEPIEDLIMKVTDATTKLTIKKLQISHLNNPFEYLSSQGSDLLQLINVLQNIEQRGIANQNAPVIPNEDYVRNLEEMGFSADDARQALITARNDIERASDILLAGSDQDGNNNDDNNNDEEDLENDGE